MTARGERVSSSKLTAVDVVKIRYMAEQGFLYSGIAETFGITSQNVSLIVSRKTWAHVP